MRSKHTEEQLAWLKNHLPKYEQKTSGATRGDAKKFALDCAATYIQLWGLPKTGNGDEEKESVVKEQIYTWFKNSCARGKDARMKHQQKKNAQQAHPPPPPHPGHHYPHHPHAHSAHAHHGHGHPPQHLPYPGPPLHHQHPPRPPHPSLQHDDLRRRESLTLPPIHSYHPRPPSPGSSNSSARGSPVLRPVYPPPPPPRHPHHLPPTSSLRSTHALSIDTVPAAPPPGQGQGQGQQNLAARLLALAGGAKVVDVAADALATPNPAPRVVDALFAAAASTSSSTPSSSSSRATSGQGAAGMGGATLPTPVSVGGGSPVRSVGMDVDDDADADAEGEPESPAPTADDVPLTVTSPSPSASLRRSLSNSPSPSRSATSAPTPTLPELLRAFAQLLSALPPADAAAARAALHCALRRPPPLPPASSPSPSTSTLHDFRERAESVRRLRREHVLWARVLSSCLSDCPQLLDEPNNEWRWFVRGCVKDALVSDDEEAGWLAGAYLLRGLRSEEREEGLVRAYEARWRDVRDERRLAEMGDVMVDLRH